MLLSEAIEQFNHWREFQTKTNTVKGYDLVLRQFCLFIRNKNIEEVKLQDVLEWFGLMQSLGWERNSFVPKGMALRKLFEFYAKQGMQVLNPWLIPVPNKEFKISRVADDKDYQKLIDIIPVKTNDPRHIRNLPLVNMLWDTGARNGELLSLDVENLDLKGKRATIQTEKNRGSRPFREIFWTEKTNDNLKRWLEKRDDLKSLFEFKDDSVFTSLCNVKQGQRLSVKGVGEILRHYCNKAGLPYINAHSFRHHLGHQIIQSGGSNSDVANLLGHVSLQSTMVYTRMSSPELEQRYRIFKGH